MDRTKQSVLKPFLAEDIDCLALKITSRVCDATIELAARGIAQFMLLCENIPLTEALSLFDRPGADKVIWKLIACQSEFLGPTPRSVGIDFVSECAATKLQSSLDVKHLKKTNIDPHMQVDRIKPQCKIDLAYSNPTHLWIRFYCVHKGINIPNTSLLEVSENVFELYCSKNVNKAFEIITQLERDYNADIVFCSELPAFLYNPLLFLSNYIKFMWCYALDRNVFDPTSFNDLRMVTLYTTYGLLFLNTNNLSNMPSTTHGPLICCSGERPKVALGKFNSSMTCINEGSRAMQSLDKSSDFGTYSNFIEVINKIELDCSTLDTIV